MKRVNDFEFYQLGSMVHKLVDLDDGTKVKECYYILLNAQRWLDYMGTDEPVPLIITRPVAIALKDAVTVLLGHLQSQDTHPSASEEELNFLDLYPIRSKAREFETVLSAELQSLATYIVSQKLAYETRHLIEEAERVLPPSIVTELEASTIEEIRQAGRCMAFDVPTATGFHILRATETVIRKYYAHVLGVLPQPKNRNWGAYVGKLRTSGAANETILVVLDHIRQTYRNPILHPEVSLTVSESQVLLSAPGVKSP